MIAQKALQMYFVARQNISRFILKTEEIFCGGIDAEISPGLVQKNYRFDVELIRADVG